MKYKAVVLAAGEGTRMKSKRSKVLHEAAGKPMIEWVLRAIEPAQTEETVLVCGNNLSEMKKRYADQYTCVEQKERLGSGHAVMAAEEQLRDFDGYTLIVAGDMPLLQPASIQALMRTAEEGDYDLVLLTSDMSDDDPTGYGRILRDEQGNVVGIVEEKDATEEQKKITEVNISCYCVKNKALLESLKKIRPQNEQGEYYITDIVSLIKDEGGKVGAQLSRAFWEGLGVNSRIELSTASSILRGLIVGGHLKNGVTFIDTNTVYIDADTTIGMDTIIHPGVTLEGGCTIGEDVVLYPGTRVVGSVLGDGTTVEDSVITDATIGKHCTVGPYTHIRPGTVLADHCKAGAFVEMKNAQLGEGSQASHLAYVGDAELGKNVNIGCGVVFVNYDGKEKFMSKVGDDAFIGCNSNLISPVQIGAGAYIAAGSNVTEDVPEDAFVIARARQETRLDWQDKRNED